MSTPKRLMIVEDEAIVAADLASQLVAFGYDVVAQVRTGEESITRAAETKPDLILMDIHLAGQLTGTEAAAIIRKTAQVPIVFLTAFSDPTNVTQAKAIDASSYLLKPFDPDELRAAIEQAFARNAATVRA